jgi:photosystem II stability/assembly factor-like uncharacterized protein
MMVRTKASLVALGALWLAACGAGVKRIATTGRPPMALRSGPAANPDMDQEGEAEDSPDEAAAFYLERRTGGGPLPVEKLFEAKRHKDTMPVNPIGTRRPAKARTRLSPRDADMGNWEFLGPGNIGGRTRGFVIRPDDTNTMYAGAEGGGVWMTDDGGESWWPLTDLAPSIAIASLAMDPNDPNTLYAGTGEYFTSLARGDSIRGAGIYKTSDGGNTWTQLPATTGANYHYVNKIVVSPNNSQHVYAATWVGVHYSADGGNTWKLVLSHVSPDQGCTDLAIRTDQPTDYLFAACAYQSSPNPGIYRNTDAAGSGKWQLVFTTAHMSRTTLAIAPSNQSIIYAAAASYQPGNCPSDNYTAPECYNDGLLGVWRSTQNGDSGTWMQRVSNQDPSFVNTLLFTGVVRAFQYICTGKATTLGNQGTYDNIIAVDPTNSDVVWVGGIDLFRSDDGGRNWGVVSFWQSYYEHADHHMIVFDPGYNGQDNQTMYVTNDGGIYATDNALAPTVTGDRAGCGSPYDTSVAWYTLNSWYAVTQFYHGSVYPGGAAYLAGSQDNNMERGSDATGPNAWTIPRYIGDGGFNAIDPNDVNVWYINGQHVTINKTTDGGNTFSAVTKGITETNGTTLLEEPLVMDPSNSKRLYYGGKSLWRTTDGAANWSAASSAIGSNQGTISVIAVSPVDPDHVAFATSSGFVFTSRSATKSTASTTWPSAQPRSGFIPGLTYDPNNVNVLYATYSQYKSNSSQSHVYQSTDGGATWTGIDGSGDTGLPDIPVFTLLVDPLNSSMLYVGTDIGLFVSTDGGATWARDANPFADVPTENLVLDRSSGQNTLFAFTHGRGVWRTVLPGSGAPCQYSISPTSLESSAYGDSMTVKVTTAKNCAWSVIEDGKRFTMSPGNGAGSGSFQVNARYTNIGTQPITDQVQIQGQLIPTTQDGAQTASGNDDVSSAFPFGALPSVVIQNTSFATQASSDPVHSCTGSADSKTVWFSLTTPQAGAVTLNMTDTQPGGSDAGAVVSVYGVNSSGARGSEMRCYVVKQRSSGSTTTQTVTWNTSAGNNYLVEVSATASGAPAGAKVTGGDLSLWVSVQ